jgi:resuscitation-promoting factor RpfA
MKVPVPSSLTPEERDLAHHLAQSAPPREPSPALDARILAAARSAAASTPSIASPTRRSPRRGWPVALGLAASLVLAVGIAWRLRPLPETRASYPLQAPAASPIPSSADSARVEAVPEAQPSATVESPSRDPEAAASQAPDVDAPTRETERVEVQEATRQSADPALVFDLPVQSAAARKALPPTAPAADNAAPQAFESVAPSQRAAAPSTAAAADAAQARSATNEATRAAMAGTAADTSALHDDEPVGDVPPATADSPAVRDAWLQRIRGLVDDGEIAAARASLHEFVRRYPGFALPEDLRALER